MLLGSETALQVSLALCELLRVLGLTLVVLELLLRRGLRLRSFLLGLLLRLAVGLRLLLSLALLLLCLLL